MNRRFRWLAAGLAIVLALRLFPVPTGLVGQAVLARMAPPTGEFPLQAKGIRYRFPFTVSLYSARLPGVPSLSSPRIDIDFSPWALMAGHLQIASIESPSLRISSQAELEPFLATLTRLDSVPLRNWFPTQYLPNRIQLKQLEVRDPDGVLLVICRNLSLRRMGDELALSIDSTSLLGALPIRSVQARGKLPFSLDTLGGELPGGRFSGKMPMKDSCLRLHLGFAMDLSRWPLGLGPARVRGHLRSEGIRLDLPLDGRPMRLDGNIRSDSVELTDLPYLHDSWFRQFVPELRHVRFASGSIGLRGLTPKHLLLQIQQQGDTARIQGKGQLGLDGSLSLRLRAGLRHDYAATRPALLRMALLPGADGCSYTSVQVSGDLREIHFSPTSEAIADAAASPFHALSELLH